MADQRMFWKQEFGKNFKKKSEGIDEEEFDQIHLRTHHEDPAEHEKQTFILVAKTNKENGEGRIHETLLRRTSIFQEKIVEEIFFQIS